MGNMKALQSTSLLAVGNDYLEAQYENYLRDPNSVSEQWREYFEQLPMAVDTGSDIPHSDVRDYFYNLTRFSGQRRRGPAVDASYSHSLKQIHVTQLINAYRVRGHQLAAIDPLGRTTDALVREVKLAANNLSEADLDTSFDTSGVFGIADQAPLREIIKHLKKCYCASIGYEFMYVNHTTQKEWLIQRIESVASKPRLSDERRKWLLRQLTAAEGIEKYLHSKYVGQKRFSLEGGESLIVIMSELVRRSSKTALKDMVIGMAHRGRLNVLVNILGKNPADLFSEFEGKKLIEMGSGDVKYHQGFSSDIAHKNGNLHLTLAFNPSHLEIVSPVVEGSVRSRQERYGDREGEMVLPVSIHGDSAFAGQGVVMETFNMAESRGFSTKGTVHIIVNNQIGFTTSNSADVRSTVYASDVAKMINAPIFHVNGDDPEAVLFVTQLALDFRHQWKKDVIIDLVCYRRHGHNEADEPSVTQPMMYKIIKSLPTTRKLYADKLTKSGVLEKGEGDQFVDDYRNLLDEGKSTVDNLITTKGYMPDMAIDWTPYLNVDWETPADTCVSAEEIRHLSTIMTTFPDGLQLHPRVAKIMDDRRKMAQGALPLDWGMAENMAYATLLKDGYPVRISGQDSGRGTFFHRHAVIHNQADGSSYVPLRNLSDEQPNFLVIDSVLSEEAVLAFEYGYATADPTSLVIWEAQFGDFANGAQVVVDQFITCGEAKWGRLCGL
ncbi:MAG: 2-oxoglutarate dehydrogenase E1 component, partial [Gammaproteobacteria bacterium]|nr:2-oxoglutarate dehydrogenase E1 component [Gammaproteobacteria bacterium]